MTYLLDVNLLIALIDPAHAGHDAAHGWFEVVGSASWATCPITENGVVRIVGHPKYPNFPGSPVDVAASVAALRALPGHEFWEDGISLMAASIVNTHHIATSGQVTDTYLLALAVSRDGRLATFDRRLATKAVQGGRAGLHVVGGG